MRLLGIICGFCFVIRVHSHWDQILHPIQTLIGWTHASHGSRRGGKMDRFGWGSKKERLVNRRPDLGNGIEGPGSSAVEKIESSEKKQQGHRGKTFKEVAEKSLWRLGSTSQDFGEGQTTAMASRSSSLPPISSTTTSNLMMTGKMSKNENRNGNKNKHLIDLKIPGGERPESENLPDYAMFEPVESESSIIFDREGTTSPGIEIDTTIVELPVTTKEQASTLATSGGISPATITIPIENDHKFNQATTGEPEPPMNDELSVKLVWQGQVANAADEIFQMTE